LSLVVMNFTNNLTHTYLLLQLKMYTSTKKNWKQYSLTTNSFSMASDYSILTQKT